MKKLIIAFGVFFLSTTMAMAVIGPIPIDESNDLPDGEFYGSITITQIDPTCVEITVDANQDILVPIDNFGIQAFGFNYAGETSCLDITAPDDWVEGDGTMDGFGVFMEQVSGEGQTRQDPLALQVCSTCGNLGEGDVVVKNAEGYPFAVHIADFTYDGVDYIEFTSAFFATKKTTAITLASFNAKPGNSAVTLVWETGDETNNFGFNIYRAESENGEYIKINDSILASKVEAGTGAGASYEFVDSGVQNRQVYFYRLEDIDSNGTATMHGPVSAMPRLIFGLF